MNQIKVAVVGLGFSAGFTPLYDKHSNSEYYAICQRNKLGN